MASILNTQFGGMIPRSPPKSLPDGFAKTANNCNVLHGDLRALANPSASSFTMSPLDAKTLFSEDGKNFWTWRDHADVVRHPTAGAGRVYFSDGSKLKVAWGNYGANSGEPTQVYWAGVPAPTTAPTVNVVDKPLPWDIEVYGFFEIDGVAQSYTNIGGQLTEVPGSSKRAWTMPLKESDVPANAITVACVLIKDRDTQKVIGTIYSSNSSFATMNNTTFLQTAAAQTSVTKPTSSDFPELDYLSDTALQAEHHDVYWQWLDATQHGNDVLAQSLMHKINEINKVISARSNGTAHQIGASTSDGTTTPLYPQDTSFAGFDITITVSRVDENTVRMDLTAGHTVTRAYTYTYVNVWGEESAPSPASAIVSIDALQEVKLKFSAPENGSYAPITNGRLYRSSSASNGSTDYFFVITSPTPITDWAGLTYEDNVLDSQLGETLPSLDWDLPPDGLQFIKALPNGVMIGALGADLCFSEPFRPFAWPIKYRQTIAYQATAIVPHGNGAFVGTTAFPYFVAGVHPTNMSVVKLPAAQRCIGQRFTADLGHSVIYLSDDGLAVVSGNAVALGQSQRLFAKDDLNTWFDSNQTLGKLNIFVAYDDKLYAFYDNGGFILDVSGDAPVLTTHDVGATAAVYAPLADALCILHGGVVNLWAAGQGVKNYTWHSKTYRMAKPVNLGACHVIVDGSCTFRLYVDGVLRATQACGGDQVFRLPAGYIGRDVEFELSGTGTVSQVHIGETMTELQNG